MCIYVMALFFIFAYLLGVLSTREELQRREDEVEKKDNGVERRSVEVMAFLFSVGAL